jgi:hypothetical protein
MFNDEGTVRYYPRKEKGHSFLTSLFSGILDGIFGFIGKGWIGAGIGFMAGFANNPPTGDRIVGGYYVVDDFNAVPDNLAQAGVKMKFYKGSFNGVATNSSGILFGIPERVSTGGTFIFGIRGTIGLNSVEGINIGDYVYIRKPIVYYGSPKKVIESLLCGSNISNPYSSGELNVGTIYVPGGVGVPPINTFNDFADDWDTELDTVNLMTVGKILGGDEDSSPFDQLKELTNELGIDFFINENNK